MSKTAMHTTDTSDPAKDLLWSAQSTRKISLAAILNTMRILKKANPGDAYYENYLGMIARYGEDFFDLYQLIWNVAIHRAPRRILEIGTRTGISLCQLLSAHRDLGSVERVVCVDPFDEWTSANLVRSNLRYLNLPAGDLVRILAMRSEDFLPKCQETFDYILVDGDHTKSVARADLEAAVPLLEPDGVILFDDISTAPGECALVDMWEDFKSEHAEEFFFAESMQGKGVGLAVKK
jgi:predicted O-methyltransferase YrrM